jgi:hypothetical protein
VTCPALETTTEFPFSGFVNVASKDAGVLEALVRVEEEVVRDHDVDADGNSADLVREALCEARVKAASSDGNPFSPLYAHPSRREGQDAM